MNAKRQLLIDTALTLFYQHGINAIGINEVLSVSGVAKRTLYNHFESKNALVLAALQQRHEVFMLWLKQQLHGANSDHEVIARLFESLARWFNHQAPELGVFRGCFFINTSAEFTEPECKILHFCHQHKQAVRELLASYISHDNTCLLNAVCLMKEGAIVSAHLGGEGDKTCRQCIQALNVMMPSTGE
ncbi:TetR/AcrR family transcriptional regulator [Motilimonas pumila]|uniref:TetR/AcrR family transcriptional regulator n=1 Tax=Motilimonas pumila TaxID=2303987 RepID=A0A418YG63_9GAMM|nr:TetR/AcrR family transcriptional regulator [Motilimonas pumila]RJG48634.1 TetR/AcrR family transcriptional regulator [Motilimonas pumila]